MLPLAYQAYNVPGGPNDGDIVTYEVIVSSTSNAAMPKDPSVLPASTKSITFTVKFEHPCHSVTLQNNGGLKQDLHKAIVSEFDDKQIMKAFPYTVPFTFSMTYDCGP